MKINNLIYLVIIVIFTITACKKSDNPKTDTESTVDIYISGSTRDNTNTVATYWKNGVAIILPANSSHISTANAIALSGSDVYVVGNYQNPVSNINIACYWKNGVITPLTDGSNPAYANAVAINGTDVYIVGSIGYANTNPHNKAVYWKNGVMTTLSNNGVNSVAKCIVIKNNDIYIGGSTDPGSSVSQAACYWKNGAITNLTTNSGTAAVYGMTINLNNDIYAAGYDYASFSGLSSGRTTYWFNGTNKLVGNTSNTSSANAIAVQGNDIYIAGLQSGNLYTYAAYWKNGAFTALTNTSHFSMANAIAVQGNDVYIAGYDDLGEPFSQYATYWKNGVITQLSKTQSQALGMVVIPK